MDTAQVVTLEQDRAEGPARRREHDEEDAERLPFEGDRGPGDHSGSDEADQEAHPGDETRPLAQQRARQDQREEGHRVREQTREPRRDAGDPQGERGAREGRHEQRDQGDLAPDSRISRERDPAQGADREEAEAGDERAERAHHQRREMLEDELHRHEVRSPDRGDQHDERKGGNPRVPALRRGPGRRRCGGHGAIV